MQEKRKSPPKILLKCIKCVHLLENRWLLVSPKNIFSTSLYLFFSKIFQLIRGKLETLYMPICKDIFPIFKFFDGREIILRYSYWYSYNKSYSSLSYGILIDPYLQFCPNKFTVMRNFPFLSQSFIVFYMFIQGPYFRIGSSSKEILKKSFSNEWTKCAINHPGILQQHKFQLSHAFCKDISATSFFKFE